MKTIKGPAIFLAQFAGDEAPFNSLDGIAAWAARPGLQGRADSQLGRQAVRPGQAAESQGLLRRRQGHAGANTACELTELSTHLQGQLVAVHPAYDRLFDGFAAPEVHGNPAARQEWAVDQLMKAARASKQPRPDANMSPFPARWPGPISTPGRNARPAWWKPPSTNWPNAGARSSTHSTSRASMFATRSTRARTCTTA